MPELPEVESIRRSLAPKIVGRRILDVVLHRRDVVVAPGDPFGGFSRQRGAASLEVHPRRVRRADLLLGATVTAVRRHGKQLAILAQPNDSSDPLAIGIQLGMSGQLFHRAAGERVPQTSHVHIVWTLEGGRLVFRDPRRFGGVRIFPSPAALAAHWATLGPDGLTVTGEQLAAGVHRSARAIKAALLDQQTIAGVGNIYADEALFAAAIRPDRPCRALRPEQIEALARAIREVLAAAVGAGGSTLRDYVDADGQPGTYQLAHAVYGRAGRPCPRCGAPLRSAQIAQRTSVWCPRCQK